MTIELHTIFPTNTKITEEPILHIVFVHGLGGNHSKTWESKNNFSWPQHVADTHNYSKVWSLSYPSSIVELIPSSTKQANTSDLVKEFSELLWSKIQQGKNDLTPIIFVCHSLGGILVKKLLVENQRNSGQYEFNPSVVKAIIFLGTPHKGSYLANCAKLLPDIKNYLNIPLLNSLLKTSDLLNELERGNDELHRLTSAFSSFYTARDMEGNKLIVKPFIETKGVGISSLSVLIVDEESGDPELCLKGDKLPTIPIHGEDHSSISKPKSLDSLVVNSLKSLIQAVTDTSNIFDLEGVVENRIATIIYGQLLRYPDLLEVPAIKACGSSSKLICQKLVKIKIQELAVFFNQLSDGFQSNSNINETIKTIAGTLILLHLPETTIQNDDHEKMVNLIISNELSTRYEEFLIENENSKIRNWPLKMQLTEDGQNMETMALLISQDLISPNSFDEKGLVHNIALQISSAMPLVQKRNLPTKVDFETNRINQRFDGKNWERDLIDSSKAKLRLSIQNKEAVILNALKKEENVFLVPTVKQELDNCFGNLISIATSENSEFNQDEREKIFDLFELFKSFLEKETKNQS